MRAGCLGAGARARAFGGAAVMAMVAVAAVGFPADAAPSAPAAGPCAVPTGLTARPVGPSTVRLVWRLPASLRGASVRVWRSGGVVGQTRGRSMVVRVHPGRRVTLAAGIVGPHGDAPRCRATVRALAGSRGAGSLPPPSGLAGWASFGGPGSADLAGRPGRAWIPHPSRRRRLPSDPDTRVHRDAEGQEAHVPLQRRLGRRRRETGAVLPCGVPDAQAPPPGDPPPPCAHRCLRGHAPGDVEARGGGGPRRCTPTGSCATG